MDSDKTNRWLTLGANIGVLIGIMLLVFELTENREMMRAQTRNDISRQIVDRLSMIANDSQASSMKRRAEVGEELSEDEEHQYFLMFVANIRDWENIHYQYRHGMFDENEFYAERTAWRFVISNNRAFLRNWCQIRRNYSPQFAAELDGLLDKDACTTTQKE